MQVGWGWGVFEREFERISPNSYTAAINGSSVGTFQLFSPVEVWKARRFAVGAEDIGIWPTHNCHWIVIVIVIGITQLSLVTADKTLLNASQRQQWPVKFFLGIERRIRRSHREELDVSRIISLDAPGWVLRIIIVTIIIIIMSMIILDVLGLECNEFLTMFSPNLALSAVTEYLPGNDAMKSHSKWDAQTFG